MSLPSSVTLPAVGGISPSRDLTSSVWPLPCTPAMPRISPASHVEATPSTTVPAVVDHGEVVDHQHDSSGVAAALSTVSLTARPTISSASSVSLVASGVAVATTLPRRTTVIRSAMAITSLSLCVMKTMDVPLSRSVAHDADQLVDLLRGQHRGRLVENQDLGVVGECLDDLHALLDSHRDVLDDRVGVDGEPVPFGHLMHQARRLVPVENAETAGRLAAEHDVLGDGEHRHQHEVLVHHPDPGLDGVAGAPEVHRFPSSRISPASGSSSPYSMFISVDLPAPFSPSRQWISPGSTVRSMASLAVKPPNRFVRPRISRHRSISRSSLMVPTRRLRRLAAPST